MASIIQVGENWRAQVRRKGYRDQTDTFKTKGMAQAWARKVEASMDAGTFTDVRSLKLVNLAGLIDWYSDEIGGVKGFGKNKTAVLATLRKTIGHWTLDEFTDDNMTQFVKDRHEAGAGGVTIAVDLTYIGTVLRAAKTLAKVKVSLEPLTVARENMKYLRISTRSNERKRRPTADEITRLCYYFDSASKLPMADIIRFASITAMRCGEITALRWEDLNEADRTIMIRERKHPTDKHGNDMEVPLLGEAFAIAKRQPRTGPLVFPVKADTISSIFPRACQALGIVDLRFHDLRHEGVSRLFEQGYRIEQVAIVSGHRDWKSLKRYTNLKAASLHRD